MNRIFSAALAAALLATSLTPLHAADTPQREPYGIALGCAGLGDSDGAMEWLEHAYREHSVWLALWGNVDPRLDVLREDSRFQDLLRRLGLG